jgi:prophage tail gpP-like protein
VTSPLTIRKDGRDFAFWTSASVSQSMDAAAQTFSFEVAGPKDSAPTRNMQPWVIPAQSRVEIFAGADLILTGIVDSHVANIDASSHSVSISGRSMAGQLVDCGILNPASKYLWKDRDPLSIMREITDPFGIKINADAALDRVRTFKQASTGRAFDAIRTLAFRSGAVVLSEPDGSIKLTQTSNRRTGYSITNVLTGSMTADFSERPSQTIVHGQSHGYDGQGISAAQSKGTADDPGVTLYRPRIIAAIGNTDGQDAGEIAKWYAARALGDSFSLSVTVPGLRDPNGDLWAVNTLTHVHLPALGVSSELLISSVEFKISGDGAIASLQFKHPGSYSTKPASGVRKLLASASKRPGSVGEPATDAAVNTYITPYDLGG